MGIYDRVWRDQPRGVPEVDPDTRGCITHTLEHVRKYCHYFTGGAKRRSATYRQPSLGMVVTYTHKIPRDDCPIRKVMRDVGIIRRAGEASSLLFRIDKTSLGVSRDPLGMIVHMQKVMPILSSVLVLTGFS